MHINLLSPSKAPVPAYDCKEKAFLGAESSRAGMRPLKAQPAILTQYYLSVPARQVVFTLPRLTMFWAGESKPLGAKAFLQRMLL